MTRAGWPFNTSAPRLPGNVSQTPPASAAPSRQWLVAFGQFLIESTIAATLLIVAKALGNVPIIGGPADAFLTNWAQTLQNKANNALATANGAQTTASNAQSTASSAASAASSAQTTANTALGNWTTLFSSLGLPGLTQFVTLVQGFVGGTSWQSLLDTLKSVFTRSTATASGVSDVLAAGETFFDQALVLPVSAGRLTVIPSGHVANTSPNLAVNGGFDTADSIDPSSPFKWDGTVGNKALGSARLPLNGTQQSLPGVLVPVVPGDKLSATITALGASVSATGTPFQLLIAYYDATLPVPNMVGTTVVAQVGTLATAAPWTVLTGTDTVPATVGGVTPAYAAPMLRATSGAASGTAWWDDAEFYKTGLVKTNAVQGLASDLQTDLQALATGVGSGSWSSMVSALQGTASKALSAFTNAGSIISALWGGSSVGTVLQTSVIPDVTAAMSSGIQSLIDFAYQVSNGGSSTGNAISTFKTALNNILGTANNAQSSATSAASAASTAQSTANTAQTTAQAVIDGIQQAINGGSTTGNATSTVKASLISLLTNLFGSGTLGTVLQAAAIPNITAAMSTDLNAVVAKAQSIVDNFTNAWNNTSTTGNSVSTVTTTTAAIKSAIANGYTLYLFTSSNPAWTVPAGISSMIGCVFNGGGKGQNGQPSGVPVGGSSGGYLSADLDMTGITPGTTQLNITVGAAATTAGTDGGVSSIKNGSTVLLQGAANANGISTPQGLVGTTSVPGSGGNGGYSQSGASNGSAGTNSGVATGGPGGTGLNGSGTGGAGTAGGNGTSSSAPLCGGAGGGGGGNAYNGTALTSATGGPGGNGGFPGGGSGAGGSATSTGGGTRTQGKSGTPGNGLVGILVK